MLTFVLVLIAIVICVVFWRILLPVAGVGLAIILVASAWLYLNERESMREREKSRVEAQARFNAARQKLRVGIENPDATWEVHRRADPASGEYTPTTASIISNDGLFRLQAEIRHDGTRMFAFYALDDAAAFDYYGYGDSLSLKFDGWDRSRKASVRPFSNSSNIYVPTYQDGCKSDLTFDEIARAIATMKRLAVLVELEHLGSQWITFSLDGSHSALEEIGMVKPSTTAAERDTPKSQATSNSRGTLANRSQAPSETPGHDESVEERTSTIPNNAYVMGNTWYCNPGYRRSGNACIKLDVPRDAYVMGNAWYCDSGYRRSGNSCVALTVPENAYVMGNAWYCNSGYRRSGNSCIELRVPKNAYVMGNSWYCDSGYRRSGNSCVALDVPENAYVMGNAWYCNSGYRRSGNSCLEMVSQP